MSKMTTEPLALIDSLHELTSRAVALELAVIGASREAALNSYGDALAQLAHDLSNGLEKFEQDFLIEIRTSRHSKKES